MVGCVHRAPFPFIQDNAMMSCFVSKADIVLKGSMLFVGQAADVFFTTTVWSVWFDMSILFQLSLESGEQNIPVCIWRHRATVAVTKPYLNSRMVWIVALVQHQHQQCRHYHHHSPQYLQVCPLVLGRAGEGQDHDNIDCSTELDLMAGPDEVR